MRATPPSCRMSAGTRSSAITATAPASSAILACSASVTSMITPPFSISARPVFRVRVPVFFSSMSAAPRRIDDCIDTIRPENLSQLNLELESDGVNRYIVTMTIWSPRLEGRKGPRYLAIVEALAEDLASGRLAAGAPAAHAPGAGRDGSASRSAR